MHPLRLLSNELANLEGKRCFWHPWIIMKYVSDRHAAFWWLERSLWFLLWSHTQCRHKLEVRVFIAIPHKERGHPDEPWTLVFEKCLLIFIIILYHYIMLYFVLCYVMLYSNRGTFTDSNSTLSSLKSLFLKGWIRYLTFQWDCFFFLL